MPTRSNEQLCRLAQAGDTAARDILLESNMGFIRKIALEEYQGMGLNENDIGIDLDDLVQEGSIGLLNAIPLFDAGRGMKFLTYAAPALRNAMDEELLRLKRQPVSAQFPIELRRDLRHIDQIISTDDCTLSVVPSGEFYLSDPDVPTGMFVQNSSLMEVVREHLKK